MKSIYPQLTPKGLALANGVDTKGEGRTRAGGCEAPDRGVVKTTSTQPSGPLGAMGLSSRKPPNGAMKGKA
jgi:hypothetical protein